MVLPLWVLGAAVKLGIVHVAFGFQDNQVTGTTVSYHLVL